MKIESESVLKALATAMNDDAFEILLQALYVDRTLKNSIYNITGVPFEDGKIYGAVHTVDGIRKDLLDIQQEIRKLEHQKT